MKKFLAVLLSVLMLASFATAMASEPGSTGNEEI